MGLVRRISKMRKCIIRKLNKKVKRTRHGKIGVSSLSKAARRLEILDKVLTLFGMRVGACQIADFEMTNGKVISVDLTVYFMEK